MVKVLLVVLALVIALAIGMPAMGRMHILSFRKICSGNLKKNAVALQDYSTKHDGMLPAGENWCDVLVTEHDISLISFICPGSDNMEGESSYAMNENAAGKTLSELPKDMVVLFEVDDGLYGNRAYLDQKPREELWNQVGGPDLLPKEMLCGRNTGIHVVLVNGHTRFIPKEKLSFLKWEIQKQDGDFLHIYSTFNWQLIILCSFALLVVAGGIYIAWKNNVTKCWPSAISLGIVSGGVGALFGNMSQFIYSLAEFERQGAIAGAIGGIIVGVCYMSMLVNMRSRLTEKGYLWDFSTKLGMAAGTVCSTIVHVTLLILSYDRDIGGIVVGIPFGVFAGGILGWITGAFIKPKTDGVENG